MKEWAIDYSLKMANEEVVEGRFTVEADDIQEALDEGNRTLMAMEVEDSDIYESWIWSVCIIDEEDF